MQLDEIFWRIKMFRNIDNISDLEYVLQFALYLIELNGLENEISSENWKIGESIEAEISKLQNTSSNSD
jgi:hypothetical protein